jgi:amino acid transporter
MEGMCYMYAGYDVHWWPLPRILTSGPQVDQIFSRLLPRRIRHLPVLGYSSLFLLIGTSYTSSYGFANTFLPGLSLMTKGPYKPNQLNVGVTAVIAITVVSLVLYRNKTLALRLNRLFAVYKVLLISVVCILLFAYSSKGIQWSHPANGWRVVPGFFAVLYAYEGWETPFYVRVVLSEKEGSRNGA